MLVDDSSYFLPFLKAVARTFLQHRDLSFCVFPFPFLGFIQYQEDKMKLKEAIKDAKVCTLINYNIKLP